MAAPSIKSGSGHSIINYMDTASSPTLYSNAPTFTGSNASAPGAQLTGSGYHYGVLNNGGGNDGVWYGKSFAMTGSVNCAAKGYTILFNVQPVGPSYAYQMEDSATGGSVLLSLKSSGSNTRSWTIDARDTVGWTTYYRPIIIDPRLTATQYASTGTLDTSAILNIEFHVRGRLAGNGFIGSMFATAYLCKPYIVINGTSGDPGSMATVKAAVDADYLVHLPRVGSGTYTCYLSYHVGDGSTATYVVDQNATFIFPPQASIASKNFQAQVPNGHLGIQFDGSGSCTRNMTNVSISGPNYFIMNAVSGDTNDLENVAISDCYEIVLSAVTSLTGCSFTNSVMVPMTTGPSITSLAISGTTGSYAADCGASTAISNVAFTAASTEYAIRITPTATASFTLTGCSFSGYATGKKIYVNDANAAHTITISGSGISAADITSAGATIVVPTTTTVIKHDNLDNGTRYLLYNVTTATELANDTVSGSGFSESFTSGVSDGDVITLKTTYQSGTTVKWGGVWSGVIVLGGTLDFSANTPDTIPEFAVWGINGSTVTECTSDYGGIEIEIDSGASTLDRRAIIAFIAYAMTSEDGIREWFGLLNILDTANVVIDEDIADLHFVNVGTVDVVLTTLPMWVRREDGTALLESGTASLTMEVSPVYTISAGSGLTPSESAQLMAIPTNTITTGATVDANIVEVNNIAVTGTGTDADPWNPV